MEIITSDYRTREVPRGHRNLDYKFHRLANIFPMMKGKEYEDLKNDIRQHGQVEPVVVYEGRILDGRNRWKICRELGIETKMIEFTGESPVSFVYSRNMLRRHLTAGQRGTYGVEMLPELQKEAKKRRDQASGKSQGQKLIGPWGPIRRDERGKAVEHAARLTGVGASTIHRAQAVKRSDPKLYADIKAGKMQPKKAYDTLKAEGRLKLRPRVVAKPTNDRYIARIATLADKGICAEKMAAKLDMDLSRVKRLASENGISLEFEPKYDAKRVISSAEGGIEAYIDGLQKIRKGDKLEGISSKTKEEWFEAFMRHASALRKFANRFLKS